MYALSLDVLYNFVKFYKITAFLNTKVAAILKKYSLNPDFFFKLKDDFKVLRYN